MSQQLAISSMFSVFALALLCIVAVNGDGFAVGSQGLAQAELFAAQTELAPGLSR